MPDAGPRVHQEANGEAFFIERRVIFPMLGGLSSTGKII
jgi:hypothetical protein